MADGVEAAPPLHLDGTWDRLLSKLLADADAAGEIDWQVSVDSTLARVHQHGATARRSRLTPTSHTGGSAVAGSSQPPVPSEPREGSAHSC